MKKYGTALFSLLLLAGFAQPLTGEDTLPIHSLKGMGDEGKFTYYKNEEYVGTSRCKWNDDGSLETMTCMKMGGQVITGSLKIEVDEEGCWTSMVMENARGLIETRRTESGLELTMGKLKQAVDLPADCLIMEDMTPLLMSQAVRAYDDVKGGRQGFSLLFVPATKITATLEKLGVRHLEKKRDLEKRDLKKRDRHHFSKNGASPSFSGPSFPDPSFFATYIFEMPPVYTAQVTVDDRGRVVLVEYPTIHGVFIREGYESLYEKAPEDALLSQPDFDVIEEKGVAVPMRDGVELATNIYRPDSSAPCPVILVRTPYSKDMDDTRARFYARRGYVFAIQDVRGRFASPGEWEPFVHEPEDGYDAIEWLAAQPWSNGKVGTMGGSYLGWTQWWAAAQHPPHLVTMIPNVSPPEPMYNFPYEHGAFFLTASLFWSHVIENNATADLSGISMEGALKVFESEKIRHLPVIDLDKVLLGKEIPYWRNWISHPSLDDYWRRMNFMDAMKKMNIPVYHQSGWFDGDGIGSKLNYLGMTKHGHQHQKLVYGPWVHTDADSQFGIHGIDFGPRAVINLQKSYLRWMDRWLKGVDNGIDREPLVSLFVMGINEWRHGNSFPLEGTRMTPFYLASEGDANSADEVKGWLTREMPDGKGLITDAEGAMPNAKGSIPDRYQYDPGDPTPANPKGRSDLLAFELKGGEETMIVAGPVSAVIHASSSAKDTDWIMRLAKFKGKGRPLLLAEGVIRARYRDSCSEPSLIEPGKIYEYHLDMWQTGFSLEKGERLLLVISSAHFPKYSRNLNTGGHNECDTDYVIAEQTIHHDKDHPSHLLLPVIQ